MSHWITKSVARFVYLSKRFFKFSRLYSSEWTVLQKIGEFLGLFLFVLVLLVSWLGEIKAHP